MAENPLTRLSREALEGQHNLGLLRVFTDHNQKLSMQEIKIRLKRIKVNPPDDKTEELEKF